MESIVAGLVQGILWFVGHLPRPLLQLLGRFLGYCHYRLNTRAALVTRANIDLCMPGLAEPERMVRDSLIHTGMTALETPAVWFGDSSKIDQWVVRVHNEALLREAIDGDSGLLVLLPHLGNWELFNVFIRRYGKMTALYQPPKQPYLQTVMRAVRAHHGNRMVPTTGAGVRALFRTLEEGGTVVVLPDQVPATGVYAPFFGQPALTDVLVPRLLRKTGAKVVGMAILRGDDGMFDVHILPPDKLIADPDNEKNLPAVNALVERCVGLAPAQYQWEYKRFRERPPGSAKIYRFNKPPGIH